MRVILCLCLLLWSPGLMAQSRTVLPHELSLSVSVERTDAPPFVREMILLNIRGVYRRHITRETLVQPDLEGFSWSQLGPDAWSEELLDGKKVKVLNRRMAIYPDRPGTLTIGPFVHKLTLTDEVDDWFEHRITSEPVSIEVKPAPETDGWWFPVRSLKVSDQWSNAPDQLASGEGVLRVVRLEALGVTPEMIPPMPKLNSPSAMIFPHPEKRLVELTPEGPVTYAFWRWTIRPSNDISTIVEPLSFSYFDTRERVAREVTISAQRIAYGDVLPEAAPAQPDAAAPARLPGWPVALAALLTFGTGLFMALSGWRFTGRDALRNNSLLDPLAWRLRWQARANNPVAVRRLARLILRRDGPLDARLEVLNTLDRALFDPAKPPVNLRRFAGDFLRKTP
ncbi:MULTISPECIES: hypothetical protein [unclassified Roseovarius]|uniref:hypothetical protein n=1 Tax=unclassified Roseovarius TaxID=2614913 RepID=UPI00273EB42D|nr:MULTISPECIES: hypothetical protein [unclassified Roseovarius]